jgi:hypothetical protein
MLQGHLSQPKNKIWDKTKLGPGVVNFFVVLGKNAKYLELPELARKVINFKQI